jgi:hypothetical protein
MFTTSDTERSIVTCAIVKAFEEKPLRRYGTMEVR